jgi:hypothetical protein
MKGYHFHSACGATALLFLLALLSRAAAAAAAPGIPSNNNTAIARARLPSEISPTVSIFFLEDVIPFADDEESSVCIEMVKRASGFAARRLNFGGCRQAMAGQWQAGRQAGVQPQLC